MRYTCFNKCNTRKENRSMCCTTRILDSVRGLPRKIQFWILIITSSFLSFWTSSGCARRMTSESELKAFKTMISPPCLFRRYKLYPSQCGQDVTSTRVLVPEPREHYRHLILALHAYHTQWRCRKFRQVGCSLCTILGPTFVPGL
jgi:hypothetical protein